jgi:hypothetical protein
MKKTIILLGLILLSLSFIACTGNRRAKRMGGTVTYELDETKKFVNITWKDDNLWVLTRERKVGETPETYTFKEESKHGIIEGKVIIVEK